MPVKLETTSSLKQGFRRGTYEMDVKNVWFLKTDCHDESEIFEISRFRWKVALLRGYRNSCRIEFLRVFLFNCNAQGVHADVSLTVGCCRNGESSGVKRKTKVACPFQMMDKREIPLDKLTVFGDGNEHDVLTIVVDLKNIREATENEQRPQRCHMRTIHLELISNESINQTLNKEPASKILSPDYKRNSDIYSGSLVRLWAEQNQDHRYWLCERCSDGSVNIKRCLNEAALFDRFEAFCVEHNGGFPWITVFKEEKKSNESFQPIDENTVFVFCKLSEQTYSGDSMYLGNLLVQNTMRWHEVSARIAYEMARLSDGEEYTMLLEKGDFRSQITALESTLEACGVYSGSILILEKSAERQEFSSEDLFDEGSEHQLDSDRNGDGWEEVGDMVEHDSSLHGSSIESVQQAEATNAIRNDSSETGDESRSAVHCRNPDSVHDVGKLQCSNETASGLKEEPNDAQMSAAKAGSVEKDEVKTVQKQEERDDRLRASHLMDEAGKPQLHRAESPLVLQPSASEKFTSAIQSVHKDESDAPNFEMSARVETDEGAKSVLEKAPKTVLDTHQGERRVNNLQTSKVCRDSFLHSNGLPLEHLMMCPDGKHQQRQIKHSSASESQASVTGMRDAKLECSCDLVPKSQERVVSESAEKRVKERGKETEVISVESQNEKADMRKAFRDAHMNLMTNLKNDFTKQVVEAIREIGEDVHQVGIKVTASGQETLKANLMVVVKMECLTKLDSYLDLRDRDGRLALQMTDDFVKHEPIFILDLRYEHRIRISLAHRHQTDTGNFRIRNISVKPLDGLELGLRHFETKLPTEGAEVVAYFPSESFQSSSLSSGCPQFGTVDEKYVSIEVIVGVEAVGHASGKESSNFDLKARIRCHSVKASGMNKIRQFRRIASDKWKQAPQWSRDAAKGASCVLKAVALPGVAQSDRLGDSWSFGGILQAVFGLPCVVRRCDED